MSFYFWVQTLISYFWPDKDGYYGNSQFKEEGYVHNRDKHPVREKHHGGGGWEQQTEGSLRYRDYASYDEYVVHQKQKFDEILKITGGFARKDIVRHRIRFYKRFQMLPKYLPKSAHILCAGARQGTEVKVLRDLGFFNAYGVDLNPGPKNRLVFSGDFMRLGNQDSSLDLIYSNCIDHAFDLEAFFKEHARVLKPEGYVLYEIALQQGGAFEAVEWESDEVIFLLMLKYFKNVIKLNIDGNWKWVLLQGKRYLQIQ